MKKRLLVIVLVIFNLTILYGCTNKGKDVGVVNISIINSKPEIQVALEEAIKEFSKQNLNIKVKIVKYSKNQSDYDKIISMYAYGNAPTILLMDSANIKKIKNNFLDLSSEKWIDNISGEISNIAKNDNNEVVAFPFSTEGMGFIYNKKVIDEAGIDVSNINTIKSLEEAFKKVEATGKKATIITNDKWSLADHFLATAYSAQSKDANEVIKYIENLKNGDVKLENDVKFNGVLDTFDLMKKYNIYKDSPLMPSYDECMEIFSSGDIGFWYMGNWVSKSLLKNNNEYGFIPVPISNNSSDYGNNEIVIGVTKYLVIDKINSSKEQQEAAKKFLDWIVYEKEGQEFLVSKSGLITSFDNNEIEQTDLLSDNMIKYKENGKSMELINSFLPEKNSEYIGEALRKYLSDEIDRKQLIDIVQKYWAELE